MKSIFATILFGLLLIMSTAQAEEHRVDVGEFLSHNQRLLDETTIGNDLKTTTNATAEALLEEARVALRSARIAYKAKRFETAKDFSLVSIHAIYAADRAHYGL